MRQSRATIYAENLLILSFIEAVKRPKRLCLLSRKAKHCRGFIPRHPHPRLHPRQIDPHLHCGLGQFELDECAYNPA